MKWCYQLFPQKKKFNVQTAVGKILASIWDSEGFLLVGFSERRAAISSEW
jgi:hypothetical protein